MECKYIQRNASEHKCLDYYQHHICSRPKMKIIRENGLKRRMEGLTSSRTVICCRLVEWKKKIGVCPYDSSIHSTPKSLRKPIKDKSQKLLNG